MVAGGTEAGIFEPLVGGFAAMRALSTRNDDPEGASRPFDKGRDGFVIGEGAGVVVLEELEHAEARGATILAELVGYGATADASHITLPAPGGIGAVRAARRALEKAGLTPADIDHVNAHATSTPEGDKAELQAIRTIFGDARVATSRSRANKSMLGHTLGAAGAIEAIVDDPVDPRRLRPADDQPRRPGPERAEGLDLTPERGRDAATSARRSVNSFGFGGQNTALDLPPVGRMTDDRRDRRPGRTTTAAAEPDAAPAEVSRRTTTATPRCWRSSTGWRTCSSGRDLTELEVEAGGTGLVLRKPSAIATAGRPSRRRPRRRLRRPTAARRSSRAAAGREPGAAGPAVGQGPADRHLLRLAGPRLGAVRHRSAARSRSARSSASSRR